MWGRFANLLSKGRMPRDREGQITWIKVRHREWQARWHDLFDDDSNLLANTEFTRPDPLPVDVRGDLRLNFGLGRVTDATRKACFELFPSGSEMHKRFSDWKTKTSEPLPEPLARAYVPKIIALIETIGPNEPANLSDVRVLSRTNPADLRLLRYTDDITILLEPDLLAPHPVETLEHLAASLFLAEPLYVAAGNDPHLARRVCAAMSDEATDALHSELYTLWLGGWDVRLGSDGLLLVCETP